MSILISDGYTRDGYLAEVPRLRSELRFRFRPMLPAEVEETNERQKGKGPKERVGVIALAVAAHLESWSEEAPVSAAACLRLPMPVLNALYDIQAGYRASDPDPAEEAKVPSDDAELQRLVEGATLAAAEKN